MNFVSPPRLSHSWAPSAGSCVSESSFGAKAVPLSLCPFGWPLYFAPRDALTSVWPNVLGALCEKAPRALAFVCHVHSEA